jgi:hypothetical protein
VNEALHISSGKPQRSGLKATPSLRGEAPWRSCRAFIILRIRLSYAESERVTDGTRTRDLRSHNPSEHIRVRHILSQYVAWVCRKPGPHTAEFPHASRCVLASIAAALLPFPPRIGSRNSPIHKHVTFALRSIGYAAWSSRVCANGSLLGVGNLDPLARSLTLGKSPRKICPNKSGNHPLPPRIVVPLE